MWDRFYPWGEDRRGTWRSLFTFPTSTAERGSDGRAARAPVRPARSRMDAVNHAGRKNARHRT